MKRILGPLLLVVLVLGVGAAIFLSVREQAAVRRVIAVHGLIGSEKEDFFQDPRVVEALRKGGLEVHIEKAGSRQIAASYDLAEYDFAFPAGVPAAEKMRREQASSKSYDAFFTPMAVASWKPIAQLLAQNGIAQDQGGYYTLDMAALLTAIEAEKRWTDFEGNTVYPVNKSILLTSTDVRKSNSAAMYLALASYVANGNNIVQSEAEITRLMPLLENLFLKQGYVEYSSEVPFEDYLVMGMGKAPLVMIYEAQFIAAAAEGATSADMVLMYPQPTIFSKHVLVAFSEGGERLGKLLANDPELQNEPKLQEAAAELQRLAIEFGFRNNEMAYFREFAEQHQLAMPAAIVNVVEPPSYEILENMIQRIENQY
ncbi:MAG: hypothetical protein ACOYZ7_06335 [Chloroflexota bacterium]